MVQISETHGHYAGLAQAYIDKYQRTPLLEMNREAANIANAYFTATTSALGALPGIGGGIGFGISVATYLASTGKEGPTTVGAVGTFYSSVLVNHGNLITPFATRGDHEHLLTE